MTGYQNGNQDAACRMPAKARHSAPPGRKTDQLGWTAAKVRHSYTTNGIVWCHFAFCRIARVTFLVLVHASAQIDNQGMGGVKEFNGLRRYHS